MGIERMPETKLAEIVDGFCAAGCPQAFRPFVEDVARFVITRCHIEIYAADLERLRLYAYCIKLESFASEYGSNTLSTLREQTGVDWQAIHTADLSPLTPQPKYRPFTPEEAAAHLGRELEYKNKYYYLDSVSQRGVRLSMDDLGVIPTPLYEGFMKCKWRDTQEPCGKVDDAGEVRG